MSIPPGWDGVKTIQEIWKVDKNIQVVICSAYADQAWDTTAEEPNNAENLLILKKPFEVIEINQLASALTQKWALTNDLHTLVDSQVSSLTLS